ncbi:MAG: hypothetical protein WA231_12405 [Methylocella sp.]
MQLFVDAAPPYLLSFAAAVCLSLAVWCAWRDSIKAGTLLSVLFLLCVMLAYFPQLDSLNAIGVNVKLRRNLDRAEEILAELRQLAVINAKTTYMEMAWGNRIGSPSAKDKQATCSTWSMVSFLLSRLAKPSARKSLNLSLSLLG